MTGNPMWIRMAKAAFLVLALSLLTVATAHAGSASSTDLSTGFADIYDDLKAIAQGPLGRLIALMMLIVGAVMGVMRQSAMAAVPPVAMALVLYYGPGVLESILAGTI